MRCDKCSTPTEDVFHPYEQVHYLQARIAELEEALRPFADQAHEGRDYERARKVLDHE